MKKILLKLLSIRCALSDVVSYDIGGIVISLPDHAKNGSGIHPTLFKME
jgi:hypothetical protein